MEMFKKIVSTKLYFRNDLFFLKSTRWYETNEEGQVDSKATDKKTRTMTLIFLIIIRIRLITSPSDGLLLHLCNLFAMLLCHQRRLHCVTTKLGGKNNQVQLMSLTNRMQFFLSHI